MNTLSHGFSYVEDVFLIVILFSSLPRDVATSFCDTKQCHTALCNDKAHLSSCFGYAGIVHAQTDLWVFVAQLAR